MFDRWRCLLVGTSLDVGVFEFGRWIRRRIILGPSLFGMTVFQWQKRELLGSYIIRFTHGINHHRMNEYKSNAATCPHTYMTTLGTCHLEPMQLVNGNTLPTFNGFNLSPIGWLRPSVAVLNGFNRLGQWMALNPKSDYSLGSPRVRVQWITIIGHGQTIQIELR